MNTFLFLKIEVIDILRKKLQAPFYSFVLHAKHIQIHI